MGREQETSAAGFTLIEIMVVVSILGAVVFTGHDLLLNAIHALGQGEKEVRIQKEASRAAEEIKESLQYATDINILQAPPANLEERITEHSYIFLGEENQRILHYQTNPMGWTENVRQVIGRPVEYPGEGYYHYQLQFSRDTEQERLLSLSLGVAEKDSNCGSNIYASNLPRRIDGQSGAVIEFTPIDSVLDNIFEELGWNQLWRDFVINSYNDTLETGEGDADWEKDTSGEELAVSIDGQNNTHGGQLFLPLKESYFSDTQAQMDSFSVVVDAKITEDASWGYGVLLRGLCVPLEQKNQVTDFGYMFQFDPGANGFVLRRIHRGEHWKCYAHRRKGN